MPRGLQRRKLTIRVEDVELTIVLAEGRSGVREVLASLVVSSTPWPSPTIMVSVILSSRSWSSVKSCRTCTAPPLVPQDRHQIGRRHLRTNMNFSAAPKGSQLIRDRHRGHVEVQSLANGDPGIECLRAVRLRSCVLASRSKTGICSARAGSGGAGPSGSFWYSKNAMVWGFPSSVIVKSLAVRPSTGLPLLSLALTISTTNCALVENVGMSLGPVGEFWPTCCARAENRAKEDGESSSHVFQNLTRNVVLRLRMGFADVALSKPNCALLTIVFQLVNVTWLSALVASMRMSPLRRSLKRKVRVQTNR